MIFFEIFMGMCDFFDSSILVIVVEISAFSILSLIGICLVSLRDYTKYNRSSSAAKKLRKDLFMEALVTSMLTLKIVALCAKAKQPLRIPIYIGNLIYLPSFYHTEE